jgi:threonine/homoserine/homoserine lactone efflux protein
MDSHTWLVFIGLAAVSTAVPGPAVLFVLSQGLAHGRRQALFGVLGVLAADLGYLIASASGVSALLLASYELFFVIKWVGAAYLTFLGLKAVLGAWRHEPKPGQATAARTSTAGAAFVSGFVMHASNPKALLYFGTLVPQFLEPSRPLMAQLTLIALAHLSTAFLVMAAYAVLSGGFSRLAKRPVFTRYVNLSSGLLLITAGAGMALLRRAGGAAR